MQAVSQQVKFKVESRRNFSKEYKELKNNYRILCTLKILKK